MEQILYFYHGIDMISVVIQMELFTILAMVKILVNLKVYPQKDRAGDET